MTRDEALKSITLWAAHAAFQGKDMGPISAGKYADFQNRRMAGLDAETLAQNLHSALAEERFDAERLTAMAAEYGTRATQATVAQAIRDAAPPVLRHPV